MFTSQKLIDTLIFHYAAFKENSETTFYPTTALLFKSGYQGLKHGFAIKSTIVD